jgi:endonuclease/exonuclease/phosphatase family metal-dependent hydrolase
MLRGLVVALLALSLTPALVLADGVDVLAGAYVVTGRGYTGQVTVIAAGDAYDLRGELTSTTAARPSALVGRARATSGGGFVVERTVDGRTSTRVVRLSADALELQGDGETWRRVDRPGTVVLKVMTFNILGNKVDWLRRQGDVARTIRDQRPDLVFLQEVPGQTRTHSYHAGVLARAAGLHATFRGHHRTGPLGLLSFGNAILSRGRVTHADSIELPRTRDSGEQRSVVFARVEVRPGVRVNAFSTHLTSGGGAEKDRSRQVQSAALLRWLAGFRDRPLLVGGDFNARPPSQTYELLTGRRAFDGARGRLRDMWSLARMPGGATIGPADGPRRIDYLFFDPALPADLTRAPRDLAAQGGVRVLRAWTVGDPTGPDPASDHRALVATLEVAR